MGHKMPVIATVAAALLIAGCQKQTASAPKDDYQAFAACDSWQKWLDNALADEDTDYAARTDLSQPGRYPWCDALDSYYQANNLWKYGETDWRQAYANLDYAPVESPENNGFESENAPLRADSQSESAIEIYYLANPEHWQSESSAAWQYDHPAGDN